MKKFIEITTQFKFVWGMFFAAIILIYVTTSMICGNSSMDLIVVWQIVGVTILLTTFHYLFFGDIILHSLTIKYKLLIHSLLCYISLLLTAIMSNWFSITKFSLILFTGGYIILYIGCILSFYLYYKFTGEELNNRLTAYKEKKNIN